MNFEKFDASLAQTEKYSIKYNSSFPVKKRWYTYNVEYDTLSFFNEGYWIVTYDYDPNKINFVSDAGYEAYAESHTDDKS